MVKPNRVGQLTHHCPRKNNTKETIEPVVNAIAENFSPEKIILFGSYASGNPTPDSDLDLLIVMESEYKGKR